MNYPLFVIMILSSTSWKNVDFSLIIRYPDNRRGVRGICVGRPACGYPDIKSAKFEKKNPEIFSNKTFLKKKNTKKAQKTKRRTKKTGKNYGTPNFSFSSRLSMNPLNTLELARFFNSHYTLSYLTKFSHF